MRTVTFYELATGLFLNGRNYCGPLVAENTPAGFGAVDGLHDHLSRKVDLATGEVVDYVPLAPPDTEAETWAWSESVKRWRSVPTRAAIAADARADRDARLSACDWVVTKATETGEPIPAAWGAYRAALRDVPMQPGFPMAVEWPAAPDDLLKGSA